MKYYLWMDEQEHGPYTAMQLQQMIAEEQIPHDQTARAENSSEWQTVEELFQKSRGGDCVPCRREGRISPAGRLLGRYVEGEMDWGWVQFQNFA